MPMRITMTQARMGESGAVLDAGTTYTVSDAFGAAMVGAGFATDTDLALRPPSTTLSPTAAAAASALVAPDSAFGRRVDLVPAVVGSSIGAWTHTRATANASVVDCFGSMQFAFSGELRLLGWRRVANLLRFPETLSNATFWTAGASTTITAANRKPPQQSLHQRSASTWSVVRTTGAATMVTYTAASYRPGRHIFSAWIIGDGVQTFTLAIGATTQTVTPPVGVWTRVYVSADIANTTAVACTVTNATSGAASFIISSPQMEWVHGQASPSVGEYVPRDVTSYPANLIVEGYVHPDGGRAAGADGVRYYATTTPWAVASGTATRTATVVGIDPSIMLGAQISPISTNALFDSRDINNAAWTKIGSTVVNATAGDSTLLGLGSLRKIEEIVATSGWRVTQSWQTGAVAIPADNAALSVSMYCRAAERSIVYIGLRQKDGATFTYAYFDLLSGATSNVTTGVTAFMRRVGDLWLVGMTGPAGVGATAPLVQVGVTSASGSLSTSGTLGSGAWFGAVQLEAHGCPTSYLGDTGAASILTRNADATSVTLTDCPASNFTLSLEYTPLFPTDTGWKDSWWYIMSAYSSASDRNAIGLRPNVFGGAGAGMEDEWFIDVYPDLLNVPAANSWDGVELINGSQNLRPGETVTIQWALALDGRTAGVSSVAGAGVSNQVARIGNSALPLTSDSRRPAFTQLKTVPRTYWFGRQGEALPQRGEFCIRNISWRARALTATEMAELVP